MKIKISAFLLLLFFPIFNQEIVKTEILEKMNRYFVIKKDSKDILKATGKLYDHNDKIVAKYKIFKHTSNTNRGILCKADRFIRKTLKYYVHLEKNIKVQKEPLKIIPEKQITKEIKKIEPVIKPILKKDINIKIFGIIFNGKYGEDLIPERIPKLNVIPEQTFSGIKNYLISIEKELKNKYICLLWGPKEFKKYIPIGNEDMVYLGIYNRILNMVYWEGNEYQYQIILEQTLKDSKDDILIPILLKERK